MFISPVGIFKCLTGIMDLVLSYLLVIAFYFEFNSSKDIDFVLKSLLIVISLILGFGLVEYSLQYNPLIDNLFRTIPEDLLHGKIYGTTERFDAIRCQSIMTICISYGGLCSLIISFLLLTEPVSRRYLGTIIFWGIILLSFAGLLSSGSRSPFVYLFISVSPYFVRNNFGRKTKILAIIGCFIGMAVFSDSIIQMVQSLLVGGMEGGSDVEMRFEQFTAVLYVIKSSPMFGLGYNGLSAALDIDSNILGAESIWFQVLISYGFIGVLRTAYMYIMMLRVLRGSASKKNKLAATFFVLGWVAFCSFTSSPGISDVYFLVVLITAMKVMQFETNNVTAF